jgi:23S rRNA U2552 (ribose-2'-O)-methylase RlmE/FtsJ
MRGASRVDVIDHIADASLCFLHLATTKPVLVPKGQGHAKRFYLDVFKDVLCMQSIIFTQPVVVCNEVKKEKGRER